jgi:glycosyltransferase involved in cell wall biosynthesis
VVAMYDIPKITIVTVVYNAEDVVAETLESISRQSYVNKEVIIIDGDSEDETLSVVRKYKDVVSVVVTEPDAGIYDAMNKGARLASGDYITFLNAGDTYYEDDVIERVFEDRGAHGYDVIYGSNYYKKNNMHQLQIPRPLELFYAGMPFNHQSAFVKSEIVKNSPFKSEIYRIQCEYDFLLGLYLNGHSFYRSDVIVAIYQAGGYSDVNFLERTIERWLITKRYGICNARVDEHYCGLVSGSLKGGGAPVSVFAKIRARLRNMMILRKGVM